MSMFGASCAGRPYPKLVLVLQADLAWKKMKWIDFVSCAFVRFEKTCSSPLGPEHDCRLVRSVVN
jgi:hypothetical protein